jgi:hypothetical protein
MHPPHRGCIFCVEDASAKFADASTKFEDTSSMAGMHLPWRGFILKICGCTHCVEDESVKLETNLPKVVELSGGFFMSIGPATAFLNKGLKYIILKIILIIAKHLQWQIAQTTKLTKQHTMRKLLLNSG